MKSLSKTPTVEVNLRGVGKIKPHFYTPFAEISVCEVMKSQSVQCNRSRPMYSENQPTGSDEFPFGHRQVLTS